MTTVTDNRTATPPAEETSLYGVLAEFEDVDTLMTAAERVRDAGYKRWDAYTPCAIHGLDKATGQTRPTSLPWIVLVMGLTGCSLAVLLVWWTNASSMEGVPSPLRGYDWVISGKPIFSLPANIPPIFEVTILFSAFGSFFGMLALNLLPRFHHPVFQSERFLRVTQDRFFIGIEARDAAFDEEHTVRLLEEAGATHVEELEQEADR